MGVFEIKPNLEAFKLLDIKKDEKILDVAFGTGWVFRKNYRFDKSYKKIHGIDFSEAMHRVTKKD
ncbi:MAG: hypothetical protein V5A68_08115 [Candidatus Thermoplasmatota archaeon]